MGEMAMNDLGDFIVETLKAIVQVLIWGWILYILGYAAIWVFTFGRYPKSPESPRQKNAIAGVGLLCLIVLWTALAGYNNFVQSG